ncbi:MAG: glycosyltransferase, partial [Thermus sp.]|nr:glycosyltransferase [Thermus sp.]
MFRFQLLASLREKGCETLVLAPDWTPSLKAGVEDTIGALTEDYPLNRAGVSPLADLQTAVVLLWTFRRTRFSVVLTFQPKPNVYGILAAALAGVPRRFAVVEGLGFAFTPGEDSLKKRWIRASLRMLYKLSFALAHKVFFLNPDD